MKNIYIKNFYLRILKKTKGAWINDDWKETARKRRKIELTATTRGIEQ